MDSLRLRHGAKPNRDYTASELGIEPGNRKWHEVLTGIPERDRWYYQACFRRKQSLKKEPRIRLDTIHGVKGAEADHVLLCTDISTRTRKEFETKPDAEHRVFYVGTSRAKQSLHIVIPQTPNFYPL